MQSLVASRAKPMVVAFGGTVVILIVLGVAFEPDVQTIDADELVDRKDDARAFFVAGAVLAGAASFKGWKEWKKRA